MSLVTRCPACSTLFKVVPDQLRLSQGWVRCGSCGSVFNAGEQMQHAEARQSIQVEPGEDGFSNSAWSMLLDDEERFDEVLRRSGMGELEYSLEEMEKSAVELPYSLPTAPTPRCRS